MANAVSTLNQKS